MVRYRLSTLFLAILIVSLLSGALYYVAHFADPLATVVVSDDAAITFSDDSVLELTASALRKAGYTPVAPLGNGAADMQPDIGRIPDDDVIVKVQWSCKTRTVTVELERTPSNITARIYRLL